MPRSAGSWFWCGCGRWPRRPGRARIRGSHCHRTRCRGRSAPADAVLVIKRHHPVIEDLGRGDRCLAIVQLGEGDLGVGVDEGLLIDPANALQRADIEGVLRPAVAWALAVELAMRLLVRLGFLERDDLRFGEQDAVLRHPGLERV